jgi:uncharacterized integral membrane protein
MLLLILVLIFVLQNLSPASTSFFSIKWTIHSAWTCSWHHCSAA